jgi:transposase IS4-like protein
VAGDRLPDRIGVGVLMAVFPPTLVDEVVEAAGVREQRRRTLPARLVVYYVLTMVLFFQSSYVEVWNKLVAGLDWAKRFRWRLAVGMQPSAAAITKARGRVGWEVMAGLLERVAGSQAGEAEEFAFCAGMRLVAVDGCVWICPIPPTTPRSSGIRATTGAGGRSRRSGW